MLYHSKSEVIGQTPNYYSLVKRHQGKMRRVCKALCSVTVGGDVTLITVRISSLVVMVYKIDLAIVSIF